MPPSSFAFISSLVFEFTKFAVMAIASFPRSSFLSNPVKMSIN